VVQLLRLGEGYGGMAGEQQPDALGLVGEGPGPVGQ
jgi:hypothetical protein